MAGKTFDQTDVGAGLLVEARGRYTGAREGEEGVGDAVGGGKFIEGGSVVPTGCGDRRVVADGLVGEEGEDVILPHGTADGATELVEPFVVTKRLHTWSVVVLVGVKAGAVGAEEETAVPVVGAALGGDLKLGSAEASVFRVVAVGDDFDVTYGVFV